MSNSPILFYIDDDADDLFLFAEAAAELGIAAHVFSDPAALFQTLNNPPPVPSIVFADLNMPLKSGHAIISDMRSSSSLSRIPVVVLSTANDSHNREKSRDLGANYYICKPTSYDKLKDAIAFSVGIDWNTFNASGQAFVHKS
ncbi:MAG: response regulator [Flavobacterium sp. BFFFF1]|uniref:response regulator n=1 Tax=unclassified Flavobacterium TaxID=196869 RepID=UPI000BD7A62F|nr:MULTISPECIES: response regulator [unclassified Flavobacterium]OYU79920.1 MAG: response regulator [Flavobacterium sp. BFFFF1]